MSRMNKTFTIDSEVFKGLEARATALGEPMSRVLDQALRTLLAMPLPEKDEDESAASVTRSESVTLETMRKSGVPWQAAGQIATASGQSFGITERALRALERRGEVFLWGACFRAYSGQLGLAWGTQRPMDVVRTVVDNGIKKWGAYSSQFINVLGVVRKMAYAIDDVEPVRELLAKTMGISVDSLEIKNTRELLAWSDSMEKQRGPLGELNVSQDEVDALDRMQRAHDLAVFGPI